MLDAGARSVTLLGGDGAVAHRWPLVCEGDCGVPSDIALSGAHLFVAEGSAARVRRYALDGAPTGAWSTHMTPWRIGAGPDGDLVVLGRDGWAAAYDVAGRLAGAWPLPDRAARAGTPRWPAAR